MAREYAGVEICLRIQLHTVKTKPNRFCDNRLLIFFCYLRAKDVLIIFVKEEEGDVGEENVRGGKKFAGLDKRAEFYIANHIIVGI